MRIHIWYVTDGGALIEVIEKTTTDNNVIDAINTFFKRLKAGIPHAHMTADGIPADVIPHI